MNKEIFTWTHINEFRPAKYYDIDSKLRGRSRREMVLVNELSQRELDRVDGLRQQMILTAEQKGSLTHPDVIRLSQQLDVLIMEVM